MLNSTPTQEANMITLFKTAQGWMADFHGDKEVASLFGGTILPTAFTAQAEASKVLAAIQRRNPGKTVMLSESRTV
jgi:hypothetical protein